MKNQRGISLIKLLIIIAIVIGIIFIIANNQSKTMTNIQWGYMPSTEYYELRLAATTSEVSNGTGTLSKSSFETLGRDVKNAKGKWFKNSNVNFKAKILDDHTGEMVTLTDGEHVAIFIFDNVSNYVSYHFFDEEQLKMYKMTDFNLLGGYKITIK